MVVVSTSTYLTSFLFCPLLYLGINEYQSKDHVRNIDLDVDIGADAVDYNAIAKQESLSGLEVEMRKLEGIVKEIVDELNYLKRREVRMRDTNGKPFSSPSAESVYNYVPDSIAKIRLFTFRIVFSSSTFKTLIPIASSFLSSV